MIIDVQYKPNFCNRIKNLRSAYKKTVIENIERFLLTINAPLIWKMREIIFCCGQITLWAISRDILKGAKTFLTL